MPKWTHYLAGGISGPGEYRVTEGEGEVQFSVDWVKAGKPFAITK